eukprot:TRINITY_DN67542_c6_g3_i3.p1 TRINITY_DN67542_c6_g3~~TRINITY_DN67542_c6_g3_i3.p1  ORF type:complete len:211 (+),score=0.27 TRINITY_DN67542_c6_g3_i3:175-807(+)
MHAIQLARQRMCMQSQQVFGNTHSTPNYHLEQLGPRPSLQCTCYFTSLQIDITQFRALCDSTLTISKAYQLCLAHFVLVHLPNLLLTVGPCSLSPFVDLNHHTNTSVGAVGHTLRLGRNQAGQFGVEGVLWKDNIGLAVVGNGLPTPRMQQHSRGINWQRPTVRLHSAFRSGFNKVRQSCLLPPMGFTGHHHLPDANRLLALAASLEGVY